MLKQRVRSAFGRAAAGYDAAARIQQQVARRLLEHSAAAQAPTTILDAGCGTGFALPLLHAAWPQARLLAVDFAERMLGQLQQAPAPCTAIAADLERLPLADASAELYWSSLCLQWCELPAALAEARRVLAPGGALAFSTLADATFHELRSAFAGIDEHAHTLAFLTPAAIAAVLRDAGFSAVQLSREPLRPAFADLRTLLRSIREVGAGEVAGRRRSGLLGRKAWREIEERYARQRQPEGLPLTYDVVYVVARR